MIIRRFEEEDAEEIYRIIKECFEFQDIGKHTKKGIALQIQHNDTKHLIENSKNFTYFVAEIDGKPVGICGLDQAKIRTLFIDLNYQDRGIGKKLLSRILKEAKSKGVKKLITWSTFYARHFYSKFGFEEVKEIKLPEGKEDMVLIEMEKDLD